MNPAGAGTDPRGSRHSRVPGRTWREISISTSFEIRNLLLWVGGAPDRGLEGNQEIWRVRLGKAVFTGYGTGTVYCNGGNEPNLAFLYQKIGDLTLGA